MASENDSILSNNFGKNSTNCNNNEAETSTNKIINNATTTESKLSGVNNSGDYKNIRACGVDVLPIEHQPRREENPFSFKHFLNRETSSSLSNSTNSNPISINISNTLSNATTTTALSNEQNINGSNNNSNPVDEFGKSSGYRISATSSSTFNITLSPATFSIASSTPSTSSPSSSYQTSTGARPKIPQSILNYLNSIRSNNDEQQPPLASSSISTTSISSLTGETSKMKRSPRFPSFDSQASLAEFSGDTVGENSITTDENIPKKVSTGSSMTNFFSNTDDYDRQFVHRSYSNYDIDVSPRIYNTVGSSTSPRRRPSPATGGLNSDDLEHPNNCNLSLHLNTNPSRGRKRIPPHLQQNFQSSSGNVGNINARPTSEFSAALPDFVQDHLVMEQWYSDMNPNSPPNSPVSPVDFVEDLPSMNNHPSDKCQTLPDFLSDGPINHSSSGRLADVAAGLPDLDSPEENSPTTQLARFRLENDRLRRELDESRLALADQTRRAGELERRLEQARSNETSYSVSLAHSMEQVEENLDRSNKRAAAAHSQVNKLKQQVKQLTAEVETLRRENESLREDGAIGGDRVTRRSSSRTQQLSRDLMRAASNAENNLRQLLSGVENLRSMAATIENMDRIALDSNNQSNPANEEFLSDCDVDFDEFTGPAL